MKSPVFLPVAILCLLLDIFFIALIPALGQLSLLGLFLVVPVSAALSLGQLVEWSTEQSGDQRKASGLASLLCGSGLIFLAAVVLFKVLEAPEQGDIWSFYLYLYLFIVVLRLNFGALATSLVSVSTILAAPTRAGKIQSLCGAVCCFTAAHLLKPPPEAEKVLEELLQMVGFVGSQNVDPVGLIFIIFFVFWNFCYGLLLSGVLQWLLLKLRGGSQA